MAEPIIRDPVLVWLADYSAMMKAGLPALRDSVLDKSLERIVEVEIYLRDAKKLGEPRCQLSNDPRCASFPNCSCGVLNSYGQGVSGCGHTNAILGIRCNLPSKHGGMHNKGEHYWHG